MSYSAEPSRRWATPGARSLSKLNRSLKANGKIPASLCWPTSRHRCRYSRVWMRKRRPPAGRSSGSSWWRPTVLLTAKGNWRSAIRVSFSPRSPVLLIGLFSESRFPGPSWLSFGSYLWVSASFFIWNSPKFSYWFSAALSYCGCRFRYSFASSSCAAFKSNYAIKNLLDVTRPVTIRAKLPFSSIFSTWIHVPWLKPIGNFNIGTPINRKPYLSGIA